MFKFYGFLERVYTSLKDHSILWLTKYTDTIIVYGGNILVWFVNPGPSAYPCRKRRASSGLVSRVLGLGFRVLGCKVLGSGVWGLGFLGFWG